MDKLPLIYSSKYNISFFGIENLHPFDTKKFGKIYRHLTKTAGLDGRQFYTPQRASDEQLRLVHTEKYLRTLRNPLQVALIAELPPLALMPPFLLRRRLLEPVRTATGGTILGAKLALQYGWAINLGGGYHHAKARSGGGFCFFADIPIAIYSLWKGRPDLRVLIVDLDAHQGNGCSAVLGEDPRVAILDVYNRQIYPQDYAAEQWVQYRVPLPAYTGDDMYLAQLEEGLTRALAEQEPHLVIYNAGTDIYEHDHLGGLSITEEGILQRDRMVFAHSREKEVPILMVLSGGYHPQSGLIVGKSVADLVSIQAAGG